ncbi:hypothetical protein GGS21DRAFT_351141 [Xylaria nigripes]|nr:hypothetical protein GGS21DRAFT_351141 [Xylaria nigripes]
MVRIKLTWALFLVHCLLGITTSVCVLLSYAISKPTSGNSSFSYKKSASATQFCAAFEPDPITPWHMFENDIECYEQARRLRNNGKDSTALTGPIASMVDQE